MSGAEYQEILSIMREDSGKPVDTRRPNVTVVGLMASVICLAPIYF